MKKLTKLQLETMEFCTKQIDEARKQNIDISKVKKREYESVQRTIEAQNGIVYTPCGRCTIRTLKALEEQGLIEILEDNSGIGTCFGAFPSKIKVLNY
jgi:hypothetical protein